MQSRMRLLMGSIASLGAVLTLVGCDDFLGIGNDVDVDVIAEVRQAEDSIGYTIENRGSKTVFLDVNGMPFDLEHREGGEWKQVPLKDGVSFIQVLLPTIPIAPGQGHKVGGPISETNIRRALAPGKYRYNVKLFEGRSWDRPLPDEVRISNVVRID